MPFNDFSLLRGATKQPFAYFERTHQERVEDPYLWYAGLLRVCCKDFLR